MRKIIKNIIKTNPNLPLLLTRLIIGYIFVIAGWTKVTGMQATIGFFNSLGIPAPLTYLVSYLELIGGVLLALGLFPRIISGTLAIVMITAIFLTKSGGFEIFSMPLATLAGLLAIIATGGGGYAANALVAKIIWKKTRPELTS